MNKLIICILLCISFPVFGVDDVEHEDIRAISIDGKDFVAFDRSSALFLLDLRIKYPKLNMQLQNQEHLIRLKDTRIDLLEKNLVNLNEQKTYLFEEVKGLQTELDSKDAWYRSSYLWFSVGVVLGIGATIAIVYGVS